MVGEIAGKILRMKNPVFITYDLWEEIKELAASALTQVQDKYPLATKYFQEKEFGSLYKPQGLLKNLKKVYG